MTNDRSGNNELTIEFVSVVPCRTYRRDCLTGPTRPGRTRIDRAQFYSAPGGRTWDQSSARDWYESRFLCAQVRLYLYIATTVPKGARKRCGRRTNTRGDNLIYFFFSFFIYTFICIYALYIVLFFIRIYIPINCRYVNCTDFKNLFRTTVAPDKDNSILMILCCIQDNTLY